MDEFKIIENIKTQAEQLPQNLILSIGDDAALFQGSDNFTYMITTDTFNQFVHFDFIYQKPKDIGFKSVVASLSDIAAMGGNPLFCQFSLSSPKREEDKLSSIIEGVIYACETYAITLSGGDITSAKEDFSLSFTIVGKAEKNKILKRSSAKIGDTIYLSGPTGWADLGLKILRGEKINCPDEKHAKKAFLYPEAKIDIGKRIADLKVNSGAAIDISDGLSQDAHHLAKASKVTLFFNENQIKKMYPSYFLKESVFYGGEDYQLLITHPFSLELIKEKDEHLSSLLFPVGKVIKQEKNLVLLESNGVNKALPDKGWRHF